MRFTAPPRPSRPSAPSPTEPAWPVSCSCLCSRLPEARARLPLAAPARPTGIPPTQPWSSSAGCWSRWRTSTSTRSTARSSWTAPSRAWSPSSTRTRATCRPKSSELRERHGGGVRGHRHRGREPQRSAHRPVAHRGLAGRAGRAQERRPHRQRRRQGPEQRTARQAREAAAGRARLARQVSVCDAPGSPRSSPSIWCARSSTCPASRRSSSWIASATCA